MIYTLIHSNHFENNAHKILQNLGIGNAVLIKNVPTQDNISLLSYCDILGVPSKATIRYPNLQDDFIHIVQDSQVPIKDKNDNIVISSTSQEFDLHTDEYFHSNPADYVLLHCIKADENNGGLSRICFLSKILDKIPEWLYQNLQEEIYPCRKKKTSILFTEKDRLKIKFNPYEILRDCENPIIENAVKELLNIAHQRMIHFALEEGDCLILNNKEVLHGRTAFSKNSGRLLKRVRLNITNIK
ncbi:MAG: hypothetical protein EAZ55_13300 [Cytophagales bacterium]|nr:MAG: hypothetical protein EAZ55_13300 [Cytophagales bacterium]